MKELDDQQDAQRLLREELQSDLATIALAVAGIVALCLGLHDLYTLILDADLPAGLTTDGPAR